MTDIFDSSNLVAPHIEHFVRLELFPALFALMNDIVRSEIRIIMHFFNDVGIPGPTGLHFKACVHVLNMLSESIGLIKDGLSSLPDAACIVAHSRSYLFKRALSFENHHARTIIQLIEFVEALPNQCAKVGLRALIVTRLFYPDSSLWVNIAASHTHLSQKDLL